MNISELSQALGSIADEVGDDSVTRLASVDRRVRTARRGRVIGTAMTTAAVVLALVFLPHWRGVASSPDTAAAAKTFGNLATVADQGLLVYNDAAGVKLLGEARAAAGTHSVSVIVTPKIGNLGWTQFCNGPAGQGLQYHMSVNGNPIPAAVLERLRYTGVSSLSRPNTSCDDANQTPMQVQRMLAFSPTGNIASWRWLGVQPGAPATVTLSVTAPADAAGRSALARTSLALGVFEVPQHPVLSHGVVIDRHIVDPAVARGAFVLVHRKFLSVGPGRTPLAVTVPDNDRQIYVRAFVVGGYGSGVQLKQGAPTRDLLDSATGYQNLFVDKSLSAGATTVNVGSAVAPAGAHREVAILVYSRYQ